MESNLDKKQQKINLIKKKLFDLIFFLLRIYYEVSFINRIMVV